MMNIKEKALIRKGWLNERKRQKKAGEERVSYNEFIKAREEPEAVPISKLRVEDMSDEELQELRNDERVTARKMAEKEIDKRL